MTQDVYIDLLFLINLSMDYLCLYICGKVLHRGLRFWRMVAGSAIGGVYSILSLFLPFSAPINLAIDALICILICITVFHEKKRGFSSLFLCTFLFVGISLMTGGVMTAIFNLLNKLDLPLDSIDGDGISTYLFAIVAAIAGFVSLGSGKVISRKASIEECHLTVTLGGKTTTILAMSDSGNLVKDPLSGKSVIIIDRNELSKLCDISVFDAFLQGKSPVENTNVKGLRVIPINTPGGRSFLCAANADSIKIQIKTKKGKILEITPSALIAPGDIGNSAEGCRAILPAEILKT